MRVKINDTIVAPVARLEKNQKGICCLDVECLKVRDMLEEERLDKPLCMDCIFQDNKNTGYVFYLDIEKLKKDGRIK